MEPRMVKIYSMLLRVDFLKNCILQWLPQEMDKLRLGDGEQDNLLASRKYDKATAIFYSQIKPIIKLDTCSISVPLSLPFISIFM